MQPGGYLRERDREFLPVDLRWPAAAHFDGRSRWRVDISGFPVWLNRVPLTSFPATPWPPVVRASDTRISPASHFSTLRFVEGFKDRIRAHLQQMDTSSYSPLEPDPEVRELSYVA